MDGIYVTMLGHFDILVNGSSALSQLGNSSKSVLLLKFLILGRGKPVPVSELVKLFWSEPEKSTNPENALKTMISRIRFSLVGASPLLKDCILSENKSYQWNPGVACQVDVFLFEELCGALERTDVFDEATRNRYRQALSLYAGDLAASASDGDWIVSRGVYLHHRYLELVYRLIGLLNAAEEYGAVIHVCRVALDVDSFDETLNMELMNALRAGGQPGAALSQYRHITGAYQKYFGIEPSEQVLRLYRELAEATRKEESDFDSIRDELTRTDASAGGALVCEYSILRDVYQLQSRNLQRSNEKLFLALITVSHTLGDAFPFLVLDGVMRDLLEILRTQLRKGDVVARYRPTQYALLLPLRGYAGESVVMGRIKKEFYQKYADNGTKISFQFGSLEPPQEQWEPRVNPRAPLE